MIVFLFSLQFSGEKTVFLYFLRSAQNNMTKAVDAFSKYFLYVKCGNYFRRTLTFAFLLPPGNVTGLTIPQYFNFSRYAAQKYMSPLSKYLCNMGVWGMGAIQQHDPSGCLREVWEGCRELRSWEFKWESEDTQAVSSSVVHSSSEQIGSSGDRGVCKNNRAHLLRVLPG